MRAPHVATEDHHEPGRYDIRLTGHLDARWAKRFEGLSFTHESNGTTILSGPVVDQAALYGKPRQSIVYAYGSFVMAVTHVWAKTVIALEDTAGLPLLRGKLRDLSPSNVRRQMYASALVAPRQARPAPSGESALPPSTLPAGASYRHSR